MSQPATAAATKAAAAIRDLNMAPPFAGTLSEIRLQEPSGRAGIVPCRGKNLYYIVQCIDMHL